MAVRERVVTLVIDASVANSWIFEDESHPRADAALAEVLNSGGWVTRHWHLEVRNALLVGERRGRITPRESSVGLSYLDGLRLQTDAAADLDHVLDLARIYGLSMYDAMYLELAVRRHLTLATLDRGLERAASAAGIEVLP
ncbi:MAG: type II toxin-antitoxin system VapC family toxin [Dehalococcoidia bacterium]|nr:type II toxin-antitoxin system VapC family toxin [Dehalococcoidia bacterium]